MNQKKELVAQNKHLMITRPKSVLKNKIPFAGTVIDTSEPSTVQHALKSREWKKAMSQEFEALVRNNT